MIILLLVGKFVVILIYYQFIHCYTYIRIGKKIG